MKKRNCSPLLYLGVPLLFSVALLLVAKSFYDKTARLEVENSSCELALESLSPYLESLSEYRAAERYLEARKGGEKLPDLPMGIPVAVRSSSHGALGSDGWAALREDYSWNDILTGQAFAVLSKFTSPDVLYWRIAGLDMSCSGDEGRVSLSVTLESATRE